MTVIFVAFLAVCVVAEQAGNPILAKAGVEQPLGNMEGKEVRFGVANSALWATVTTAASNGSMPIIVLSARAREQTKIEALDAGADDYVTKPFGVGELLARLRVALRHAARSVAGGTKSRRIWNAGT